ncbi:hypothetical protein THRCLA_08711 [Thraustotheca clavata]|uniref:C2 domain-containing protein n=1 Tax=Thraustotheca clavata TaxID=74557 RepID=A0A1V9Z337_9STRA|nr:hypothetical protein THRCLA_08711 [Thraustotheca clavata]
MDNGPTITRRASRGLSIEIPSSMQNPSRIPFRKSIEKSPCFERIIQEQICGNEIPTSITTIVLELPPGQSPRKGFKKVKSIENLRCFTNLLHLNLSGHGLVSMDGLDAFEQLISLNLARNSIKALKLPRLACLEILDVSGNFITQIPKALGQLLRLQYLDISGNSLAILQQIEYLIPLRNLNTASFSVNPMAQLQSYREFTVFTLSSLETLDNISISTDEREKSRKRFGGTLELEEQLQEVDRKHQEDQLELQSLQEKLEAENLVLKHELQLKSTLLSNKSKEWSAATEQLLQLQQELAMVNIDKRNSDGLRQLQIKCSPKKQNNMPEVDAERLTEKEKIANNIGRDFNRDYLLEKIISLQESEESMAQETRTLEEAMVTIRNEIVAVDQEISAVKESLLKEQEEQRYHAQNKTPPQSPKYYFDDGTARANELKAQIKLATSEAQEIERRLVLKTKDMLQADLKYSKHAMVDKNFVLFDKEISALTFKLQQITTQKAEWVDELQKLECLPQASVLRLKEEEEGYSSQLSPRMALRETFRKCIPDTTAKETQFEIQPLERMLVSERLSTLHKLQQKRFELCDLLLGYETQWEVLQEERKAIAAELHNVQHNILPFCSEKTYETLNEALSPRQNGNSDSVADEASDLYQRLKQEVLEHVQQLLGRPAQAPPVYHLSPPTSPVHIVLETIDNQVQSPSKVDVTFTYQSKFQISSTSQLQSPTFAQLNGRSQLTLDENTKLLLACKKLQLAERQCPIETATQMDIDPMTKRLKSKLEVTLISATNLPCTRRLSASCDPYVLLHIEESGNWERNHPTKAFRSNTRPNTLFPVWEEDFVFQQIESMSARLCITLMDDKKASDRHDVLGEVKIELRNLWEQKRVLRWYPILLKYKTREAAHIRLQLRFLYNRVDRLRRLVDRLVTDYILRRKQLPTFICRVNDNSRPISPSPHTTAYVIPVSPEHKQYISPISPRHKTKHYGFPSRTPVQSVSNQWETYREIFAARKKHVYVAPRRIDGCFDHDSIYRPNDTKKKLPHSPCKQQSSSANLKIFKYSKRKSRDNADRLPERYLGLPTGPSEHLKRVFRFSLKYAVIPMAISEEDLSNAFLRSLLKVSGDNSDQQEQEFLVRELMPCLIPALKSLLRAEDDAYLRKEKGEKVLPIKPLDYLAKYLYRHNPRYTTPSEETLMLNRLGQKLTQ